MMMCLRVISLLLALLAIAEVGSAKRFGKKKAKPWDDPERNQENDLLVTKKAFFKIEIDDEPAGRIVIALFGDTCPVTVQNFAAIVRGNWRQDVSTVPIRISIVAFLFP